MVHSPWSIERLLCFSHEVKAEELQFTILLCGGNVHGLLTMDHGLATNTKSCPLGTEQLLVV